MQLAMELILICVMPIEATPEELMLRAWARHTCNADVRRARRDAFVSSEICQ